jgi:putative phosphoribosyl transferase
MVVFADRADAGRRLARELESVRGPDAVVLGLPRGGVPVAFEVAEALDAPLDVIVVRKLGVPFQPELAMGAIGEGGVRLLDPEVLARARITEADLGIVERRERAQLNRQAQAQLRCQSELAVVAGATHLFEEPGTLAEAAILACDWFTRYLPAADVALAAKAPR